MTGAAWLFLSVVCVCAAGLTWQHREHRQKRWVGVAEHDFLRAQIAATQRVADALYRGLLSLASKVPNGAAYLPALEKELSVAKAQAEAHVANAKKAG